MKLHARRLVLPVALLALLLAACGGGARLDDRVLQLSMVYTVEGPVRAEMIGTRGAASAGREVECRLTTGDKPIVGKAVADDVGAFRMELDHTLFPERIPTADEYRTFNQTIECRPIGGSWVHPLRQPSLQVN